MTSFMDDTELQKQNCISSFNAFFKMTNLGGQHVVEGTQRSIDYRIKRFIRDSEKSVQSLFHNDKPKEYVREHKP